MKRSPAVTVLRYPGELSLYVLLLKEDKTLAPRRGDIHGAKKGVRGDFSAGGQRSGALKPTLWPSEAHSNYLSYTHTHTHTHTL